MAFVPGAAPTRCPGPDTVYLGRPGEGLELRFARPLQSEPSLWWTEG
jgi:hypothetical protein